MYKRARVAFGSVSQSGFDVALGIRSRTSSDGNYNITKLQQGLRTLGIVPTEAAIDLFAIAAAVQAVDLSISRDSAEDGWTRQVEVEAAVHDVQLWEQASEVLCSTLSYLSGDIWTFRFVQREQTARSLGFSGGRLGPRFDLDVACLFSGGLDSCIGAIDQMERGNKSVFVSCTNESSTNRAQAAVGDAFAMRYGSAFKRVKVSGNFRVDGAGHESSQRARSFLFIAGALLVASSAPGCKLIVPENGLIALNVPLDPTRLGSNSTRTTHPEYLAGLRRLISCVGMSVHISNPYEFQTKGEMMAQCVSQEFLALTAKTTVSCGKANVANIEHKTHCGACVPCLIRRAAFRRWGGVDETSYYIDLNGDLRAGELSGNDVRAFKIACETRADDRAAALRDVRRSGSLGRDAQIIDRYADMYIRGMAEVCAIVHPLRTTGT